MVTPPLGFAFVYLQEGDLLVAGIVASGLMVFVTVLLWLQRHTVGQQLAKARGGVLLLRSFDAEEKPTRLAPGVSAVHASLLLLRVIVGLVAGRVVVPIASKQIAALQQFLAEPAQRHIGRLVLLQNRRMRPAPGTVPIEVRDDQWQQVVERLMVEVTGVLLVASGTNRALHWELHRMRELVPHWKIFILLDPFVAPIRWPAVRGMFRAAGWELPTENPGPGTLFGVTEDWQLELLVQASTGDDLMRAMRGWQTHQRIRRGAPPRGHPLLG